MTEAEIAELFTRCEIALESGMIAVPVTVVDLQRICATLATPEPTMGELSPMEQRLKRFEAVLLWYADAANWSAYGPSGTYLSHDGGQRARDALAARDGGE